MKIIKINMLLVLAFFLFFISISFASSPPSSEIGDWVLENSSYTINAATITVHGDVYVKTTSTISIETGGNLKIGRFWTKRIPINISINFNPDIPDDYQIWVPTTAFSAALWSDIKGGTGQADLDDVRFVSSMNATGYWESCPYWIEPDTTAPRGFWVKISSINQSSSNVYMYYGNADAVSASDGDATFELFDDFSGNNGDNLNASKWTVYSRCDASDSSYTDIQSNIAVSHMDTGCYDWGCYSGTVPTSISSFDIQKGIHYLIKVKTTGGGNEGPGSHIYFNIYKTGSDHTTPFGCWVSNYIQLHYVHSTKVMELRGSVDGLLDSVNVGTNFADGSWKNIHISFDYATKTMRAYDDENLFDLSGVLSQSQMDAIGANAQVDFNTGYSEKTVWNAYYDSVKVGKYSYPEPTVDVDILGNYIIPDRLYTTNTTTALWYWSHYDGGTRSQHQTEDTGQTADVTTHEGAYGFGTWTTNMYWETTPDDVVYIYSQSEESSTNFFMHVMRVPVSASADLIDIHYDYDLLQLSGTGNGVADVSAMIWVDTAVSDTWDWKETIHKHTAGAWVTGQVTIPSNGLKYDKTFSADDVNGYDARGKTIYVAFGHNGGSGSPGHWQTTQMNVNMSKSYVNVKEYKQYDSAEDTPPTGYHIYIYPKGQIYQQQGSGINK